jgi:predicted secreted Zn-dependent protease
LPLHSRATIASLAAAGLLAALVSAPSSSGTPTIVPTPPVCSKGVFRRPGPLDLSAAAPGVTERLDQPLRYRVNGYTAAQVRAQLTACTPTAPWWGEARWWFNYRYTYSSSGRICSVTKVWLGLHTAESLPAWSSSPNAERGLAARWQSFSKGLTRHEQGHVDIARRSAKTILSDLQSLTGACDRLAEAVDSLFGRDLDATNRAESDYDIKTLHGAKQGAVLR